MAGSQGSTNRSGTATAGGPVLEHTECPRCGAPNLTTEICCFACGAGLRSIPRRLPGRPPPEAPWPLWAGLAVGLLLAGFVGYHAAIWLVGYRERAMLPPWYMPTAGAVLAATGQLAFREARRRDRRWWRLSRAPQTRLSRAHVGEDLWLRGDVQCDAPLIAPYVAKECVYYRYILRKREDGEAAWTVCERDTKLVDFRITDGEKSVYVPSGGVLFDAPLYVDACVDPGGTMKVKVWALATGTPASVCGELAGEPQRPRVDPLGEDLPAVASWREPQAYLTFLQRRARLAQKWGWALTILGVLLLIGGIARV